MGKRALKVLIPCLIALGVGAAVAGALTSGDGVITGCVYTQTAGALPYGSVRVINPSAPAIPDLDYPVNTCTAQESTLTWNQQGPAGATGPQGAPGAQGSQGPQGPAGADGTSSAGGDNGGPREEYIQFVSGNSGAPVLKGESQVTMPGETDAEQGAQPIPIDSFGFSLSHSANVGSQSGGAGAGKVTFSQLQIQRRLDRNSPLLFTTAAKGLTYPTALLSLVETVGGKRQLVAQWRFSLVTVTQVSFQDRVETDTLQWGAVQFKYQPPSSGNGKPAPVTEGGWNRIFNNDKFQNVTTNTRRHGRRAVHRHHH